MSEFNKPVVVISGINMIEGGILTILRDCLNYVDKNLTDRYKIVALVHNREVFSTDNIAYIEFKPKPTWFRRIYLEYFYFKKLSKKLTPVLWFSLHDTSPRVIANLQAVYCHNATMFYKPSVNTLLLEPKLLVFSWFYRFLYQFNIRKNNYVIVQQNWLKSEFEKIFKLDNVIVVRPDSYNKILARRSFDLAEHAINKNDNTFTFFYPSFPREFKNFEVLCEAAEILCQKNNNSFEVIVTIAGNENKYARKLYKKYKNVNSIKWVGLLPFEDINEIYRKTDTLVFPSKLETWGLPLSEFLGYNRPILVPNLPYAVETLNGFNKTIYFDPNNAAELAAIMESILNKTIIFSTQNRNSESETAYRGWKELFSKILN